jgi:hypothetical protein
MAGSGCQHPAFLQQTIQTTWPAPPLLAAQARVGGGAAELDDSLAGLNLTLVALEKRVEGEAPPSDGKGFRLSILLVVCACLFMLFGSAWWVAFAW